MGKIKILFGLQLLQNDSFDFFVVPFVPFMSARGWGDASCKPWGNAERWGLGLLGVHCPDLGRRFAAVYYHDCSGRIPAHTTRAPPITVVSTTPASFY